MAVQEAAAGRGAATSKAPARTAVVVEIAAEAAASPTAAGTVAALEVASARVKAAVATAPVAVAELREPGARAPTGKKRGARGRAHPGRSQGAPEGPGESASEALKPEPETQAPEASVLGEAKPEVPARL